MSLSLPRGFRFKLLVDAPACVKETGNPDGECCSCCMPIFTQVYSVLGLRVEPGGGTCPSCLGSRRSLTDVKSPVPEREGAFCLLQIDDTLQCQRASQALIN